MWVYEPFQMNYDYTGMYGLRYTKQLVVTYQMYKLSYTKTI